MSQKSIKEMRLEATAMLAEAKRTYAKGEDAKPDEIAKAREDTIAAKAVIDKIQQMVFSDSAKAAGEAEAALMALSRPDRPAMGGDGGDPNPDANPEFARYRGEFHAVKSIGETLVGSPHYKAFNPDVKGSSVGFEIPNLYSLRGHTADAFKTTFTTSASTLTQYQRPPGIIRVETQRLTIADLIPNGIATDNTIRYVRQDTFTNAATTVAEGGTKPEAAFDTSEVDAPVRKIAVVAKVTDEMYQDYPQMQSFIDAQLRLMVGIREEAQLLSGDGNAPNIEGILTNSGIQTQAVGSDPVLEAIHKAITKVEAVGFFAPTAIVIHPTDYQLIRLAKDLNDQYYGGGPFTGAYGVNGIPGSKVGPWGLPAVVTTAISAGTALVGAFDVGAMIYRKQGVTVTMTNSDQDDFVKNLITVRCEERLALCVIRPKAFATVTNIA